MNHIYLDYNATTPIHPEVKEEMLKYTGEHFGNPSSNHWYGKKTKAGVEKTRKQIASLLGCNSSEIVFTSGGSESNNCAIRGIAYTNQHRGNHIITSQIEHPSVIKPCKHLEEAGFKVSYLPVDQFGIVSLNDVEKIITDSTILITIMHANNEVGTIQPIQEIAKIAQRQGIIFHTDAAQSIGKIPTNVNELGVGLLSIAGHKLYAPKGVGALYIQESIQLGPLIFGAGQEKGRRAGTENVASIVGLGRASELAERNMKKNAKKISELREMLYNGLIKESIEIKLNGHLKNRLPNTLNLSFIDVDSNELLKETPQIAASTGSACHADAKEPSAILMSMGLKEEEAFGAVRFSLGVYTTPKEIKKTIQLVRKTIDKLEKR